MRKQRRFFVEKLEDRTVPALITVTSVADNTAGDGQVTLREAIQAANTDASVDGSGCVRCGHLSWTPVQIRRSGVVRQCRTFALLLAVR